MYYAAYGSNIDDKVMETRCPRSKLVSTGFLTGYGLEFRKFLTIVPAKGSKVPVAVYDLAQSDIHRLDVYEGYPDLYRKVLIDVIVGDDVIKAFVYVMNEDYDPKSYKPDAHYLYAVLTGYKNVGISYRRALLDALIRLHEKG